MPENSCFITVAALLPQFPLWPRCQARRAAQGFSFWKRVECAPSQSGILFSQRTRMAVSLFLPHALFPGLNTFRAFAEGRPATGNRGPSELPADFCCAHLAPCVGCVYCVSGSAGGDNQRRISSRADVLSAFPPLPVHRAGIFLTCSSKRQAQG